MRLKIWISIYSNVLIYPTPPTYSLHNLQGQLVGIHDLISSLNFFSFLMDLYFDGSISSHTTGPKYLIDSFPYSSVWTFGRKKARSLLVLVLLSSLKRSLINSGPHLLIILNISIARSWMVRWWIETELSFLSNSSKVLV